MHTFPNLLFIYSFIYFSFEQTNKNTSTNYVLVWVTKLSLIWKDKGSPYQVEILKYSVKTQKEIQNDSKETPNINQDHRKTLPQSDSLRDWTEGKPIDQGGLQNQRSQSLQHHQGKGQRTKQGTLKKQKPNPQNEGTKGRNRKETLPERGSGEV